MVDVLAILHALDTYRLKRDLSFRQLADEMAAARIVVPARTLNYLLRGDVARDATVRDRTVIKLQAFLKLRRIRPAKHRRRPLPTSIPVRASA